MRSNGCGDLRKQQIDEQVKRPVAGDGAVVQLGRIVHPLAVREVGDPALGALVREQPNANAATSVAMIVSAFTADLSTT